ncbi:MAG: hypothetical protein KA980_13165 [Flavobacterium sp.]|nr:hypothetical protein [Flavobacterium sp.]MBP7319148.1 hypothetical protein [Flavobacterium sp.]
MIIIVIICFLVVTFLLYNHSEKQKEGLKDIRIIFSTRDISSQSKEFLDIMNNKLMYKCNNSIIFENRYLEIKKKAGKTNIYVIGHHYCPKSIDYVHGHNIFTSLEFIHQSIINTKSHHK